MQNVSVTRRSDQLFNFACSDYVTRGGLSQVCLRHCQRTHKPSWDIYYCRTGRKTTPSIVIVSRLLTNLKTFPNLSLYFQINGILISIHADPPTRLQVWLRARKSERKHKDPVMRLHIWSHTEGAIYIKNSPYLPWSPVQHKSVTNSCNLTQTQRENVRQEELVLAYVIFKIIKAKTLETGQIIHST